MNYLKKNSLIIKQLEDELIIVDTENSQIHSLNETAAMIWKMLDHKLSVDNMAQSMLEKFNISVETAKSDVEKILKGFYEKGLLS